MQEQGELAGVAVVIDTLDQYSYQPRLSGGVKVAQA
jgi:hypothetical protein